jgi:hypothetical protein
MAQDTMTHPEVRPFQVDVLEEDLDDLRRRILATRWPEKETVEDQSQGVQLATYVVEKGKPFLVVVE